MWAFIVECCKSTDRTAVNESRSLQNHSRSRDGPEDSKLEAGSAGVIRCLTTVGSGGLCSIYCRWYSREWSVLPWPFIDTSSPPGPGNRWPPRPCNCSHTPWLPALALTVACYMPASFRGFPCCSAATPERHSAAGRRHAEASGTLSPFLPACAFRT